MFIVRRLDSCADKGSVAVFHMPESTFWNAQLSGMFRLHEYVIFFPLEVKNLETMIQYFFFKFCVLL